VTGFVFHISICNRLITITSAAPLINVLPSGQVLSNQDGHGNYLDLLLLN